MVNVCRKGEDGMTGKEAPHQIEILESFSKGPVLYRVSNHFYNREPLAITRDLSFKDQNMSCYYLHSSVFLNKKQIRQPIYIIPQDIVETWFNDCDPQRALVLGCAGCTIPRFLILKYQKCYVTGVELSEVMIRIARRYFYIEEFTERFHLIHGDALSCDYFNKEEYDLIFVNLFENKRLVEGVLSEKFILAQYQHLSPRAILLINFLDTDPEEVASFVQKHLSETKKTIIVKDNLRCFLVVAKSPNNHWYRFVKLIGSIYRIQFPTKSSGHY